jgi:hypothetical protein
VILEFVGIVNKNLETLFPSVLHVVVDVVNHCFTKKAFVSCSAYFRMKRTGCDEFNYTYTILARYVELPYDVFLHCCMQYVMLNNVHAVQNFANPMYDGVEFTSFVYES